MPEWPHSTARAFDNRETRSAMLRREAAQCAYMSAKPGSIAHKMRALMLAIARRGVTASCRDTVRALEQEGEGDE